MTESSLFKTFLSYLEKKEVLVSVLLYQQAYCQFKQKNCQLNKIRTEEEVLNFYKKQRRSSKSLTDKNVLC